MAAESAKLLRCAIYTRKSTEHGLEQEFNSLDAQREACEAYIKSQASQGWKALPQHYDDPAYSGGNLDRPALKKLLADIEAGKIDVVVVYKIDRLTRSLADFAKLVEAFDARSISFVAVTQQFNTTTSMGRLTLNVLLSFAQFERELSSERVRDKVAASGARANGPAAPSRSATTPRTRSSSSTRPKPKPSARSSGATSNSNPSANWSPISIAGSIVTKRREHQGRKISGRHSLHLRSPRLLPQEPHLSRRDPPRRQMVRGRARGHRRPRDLRAGPAASRLEIQRRGKQSDPKAAPCSRASSTTTGVTA